MVAYLIGTVRVRDPERFSRYVAALGTLSAEHGGESVVRGQVEAFLEGDGEMPERVVVTRFPSAEAARAYIASAAYQAARVHRLGAAEVVLRLVT